MKKEIPAVLLIVILTAFTRIFNLLNIPLFTDEAIYIRWAQIGLSDPAQRFISLTDGKQPLLTWLMYPALKIFSDPLFAGRIVSSFSGIFAVIGMYFLTRELFGRKAAFISAIVYILSPFTLIYDRLALMDSLLAAFCIWSLYLEMLLVKKQRLDIALLLGWCVGLGMLTKSSALFYLLLMPVTLLLFDFRKIGVLKRLVKWAGFAAVSVVESQIIYNLLRLSPWFYIIELKNYSFIMTPKEFLSSNLATFIPNLDGLTQIFTGYMTIPYLLLLIFGLYTAVRGSDRRITMLFLWFVIPFISFAAFAKVIFPRFILFMTVPLFAVIAYAVSVLSEKMKGMNKAWFPLLMLCLSGYVLYTDFQLLSEPFRAAIPRIDRNQLFDNWPSGYGVREVVTFLNEKSKLGKVVVGTEGTFGLFPAGLEMYLINNPNVEIHGYWPVSGVPGQLLAAAKEFPTYLVFKERENIPSEWPLRLVDKYRRGSGNSYMYFYQVDLTKIPSQ